MLLVASLGLAVLSGTAMADTPPTTGLGQAWPNAPDVSASPNYHAYVFVLGGIRYIQINDLNGNVLGSVGTSGGQFITLPIGKFAALVATPQQAAAAASTATPSAAPTTVYNDGAATITATPMTDGTMQLKAAAICSDPATCSTHGGA
jgi:hypothetical protein